MDDVAAVQRGLDRGPAIDRNQPHRRRQPCLTSDWEANGKRFGLRHPIDPIYRRPLLCLAGGYAAFVVVYVGVPVVRSPSSVIHVLNGAFLVGLLFTAVAGAVYLPILLAARRSLKNRGWLALLGAGLFPAPMAGLALFSGRRLWNYWLAYPHFLLLTVLPFAVAGAVLGWLLARQKPELAGVAL